MTRTEIIDYCLERGLVDILNQESTSTDLEFKNLLTEYIKKDKLTEIVINYNIKTKSFVFNNLSYSLSDENRGDINGMITLGRDSFIGTIDANGKKNLTPHTLVELIALFNAMADYLISIKGIMYFKKIQLEALKTMLEVEQFDITI